MAKKDGAEDAPKAEATSAPETFVVRGAVKRELPKRRASYTYEFHVSDSKGFFTVGEYEDGQPGELFIHVAKQGSTLSGLMDSFAISVSHGLQYGVPLKSYAKTMMSRSYAPSGMTDDPEIRTASSITDYIFRRLALDYLSFDDRLEIGLANIDDMPTDEQISLLDVVIDEPAPIAPVVAVQQAPKAAEAPAPKVTIKAVAKDSSAPLCYNCGNQTQRSGSCYVCTSCGSTTGCS
jgi:ribonucleoside-diphosphate reductase alpha chain